MEKYGWVESGCGVLIVLAVGITCRTASVYWAGVIMFWLSMFFSTRSRRFSAAIGCWAGSYALGEAIIAGEQRGLVEGDGRAEAVLRLVLTPAAAEVRAHRGLDAVGAVAEVDRVQVLGEDLVLGPAPLEVVGERGLAELLEDRAVALRGEAFLTNCCVIVEAPWVAPWRSTSCVTARAIPVKSTPWCW